MKRDRGWLIVFVVSLIAVPLSIWANVALIRYVAGGCQ